MPMLTMLSYMPDQSDGSSFSSFFFTWFEDLFIFFYFIWSEFSMVSSKQWQKNGWRRRKKKLKKDHETKTGITDAILMLRKFDQHGRSRLEGMPKNELAGAPERSRAWICSFAAKQDRRMRYSLRGLSDISFLSNSRSAHGSIGFDRGGGSVDQSLGFL